MIIRCFRFLERDGVTRPYTFRPCQLVESVSVLCSMEYNLANAEVEIEFRS